jgi:hypothetical protein
MQAKARRIEADIVAAGALPRGRLRRRLAEGFDIRRCYRVCAGEFGLRLGERIIFTP